jgi:hypothetical protein
MTFQPHRLEFTVGMVLGMALTIRAITGRDHARMKGVDVRNG